MLIGFSRNPQLFRPNWDEWLMLVVSLQGKSIPVRDADTGETVWFGGQANQLSKETIAHPLIDGIHFATKRRNSESSGTFFVESAPTGCDEIKLPSPASSPRSFDEVVRMRRSAFDFLGGNQSMSITEFSAISAVTAQPLSADFARTRFIQLYLYAHRVDGLEPGVYRCWPECAELEQVKSGDQRVAAPGLSLGQDLAGNACITFSMKAISIAPLASMATVVIATYILKQALLAIACISPPRHLAWVPRA